MDIRRPIISVISPSVESSNQRTPHRPQRPKKSVKSIWVKKGSIVGSQAVLPQTVKKSAMISLKQTWKPKGNYLDSVNRVQSEKEDLKDYAIIDSGCSGSMTGDKDKLSDFKEFKGGYVAFGNDSKGGRISGKGTIKTSCLDFEKVSYVEELKFNLLSVTSKIIQALITHVGMKKGKQHRASSKKIEDRTVRETLLNCSTDLLDRFIESITRKSTACVTAESAAHSLGVFSWPTRMKHDDMLHEFIVGFWKQARHKVKTIRCDHGINHLGKFDGKSEEDICVITLLTAKGLRVYNRSTRKVQTVLHLNFLENQRTKRGNVLQRIAFEEEKRRISIAKGKEHVDSTFTLSTANTPPQSTGNTPTDSDDDTPKDGIFSTNSFDAEEGGVADYNNMDPTIDVPSTPTLRIHKIHPQSQIIGKKEPKKVSQALADESWVEAMQEELLQFKLQEVWVLCDLPEGKRVIGTKWVFRNKRDERGTIIKNKARLVAQGYRQEEGVDYDEVFAPVARIEAIRLFFGNLPLSMGFMSIRWIVQKTFLYGNITEEVYVKQPPGFEDPAHPNKVYRVVKALYGLHQAPRAWYERLSTFLLKHGYRRGAIDKTLFIKKDRRDIMLVQVYVDDIIFGSTKSSMVKDFEDLMQKEFKMSSMGELTFFLGLQVKQSNGGIFLSQDKYVKDILNKFDFRTIKPASTPIEAHKSLGKDEEGE
ncbi:retrovirus-related pol polyprotein from transposon TNT 1-94 [Tanacetum coccineum]